VPLAVTSYDVGLFVHIVAVVVGIGATYSYGMVLAYVERQAPKSVPSAYTALQRTDRFIVTPGLIVVLLAGLYLVNKGDISMGESWVVIGLVAVIALLGLTHAYFAPRWRKGIELAERDLKKGDQLSDEFKANSRQIAIGGGVASLIVLVTIFFMVAKP
jgi:uncharacterized membrane protein